MRDAHKSNSETPKNQAAAGMKVFPVSDPRRCNSLVTGYWLLVTGYWLRSVGKNFSPLLFPLNDCHRQIDPSQGDIHGSAGI
jgi:hypothetical protein